MSLMISDIDQPFMYLLVSSFAFFFPFFFPATELQEFHSLGNFGEREPKDGAAQRAFPLEFFCALPFHTFWSSQVGQVGGRPTNPLGTVPMKLS